MTRQKYSEDESLNRIVRSLEGKDVPQDTPGTVPGTLLSSNEALSDLTELMAGSLPNENFTIPSAIANAIAAAGFERGWGGGYNFYVWPDHANASDANTGRDPIYPLATIQQAVTNARAMSGDIIWVIQSDSWQYGAGTETGVIEAVTIPATKPGLRLGGVGAGAMGVNWQVGVTGTYALTINAIDTVVDGFNFWDDNFTVHGILCDWNAPTAYGENTIIRNCTFADDIDIAIHLIYTYFVTIENCHFQGTDWGIHTDAADGSPSYVKILNNWFHDCTDGAIFVPELQDSLIDGNRIFSAEAQATGTATDLGIVTNLGYANIVSNNYFSCHLANWDTFNSANDTDAWINNHVMNGNPTTNPA